MGEELRPIRAGIALVVAAVGLHAPDAAAGTSGAVYDMDRLLNEPYPFAPPAAAAPMPRPAVPAAPVPRRQAQRAPAAPRPAPPPPATIPEERDSGRILGGIVSEVRGGVLAHDQGPFSSNKEDGVDLNLEVLFTAPDLLKVIWSPRPHVGLTGNTAGDTDQFYVGLGWEWDFLKHWFAGFTLGGAVHDGELTTTDGARDKKELGCRLLFRESVDAGYRFGGRHSLMLHFSHISNAKLCEVNEGLENVGIRYGYRF